MKNFTILVLALGLSLHVLGQNNKSYQILSIQEEVKFNDYQNLEKLGIVDINSQLRISLNTDSLALSISQETGSHPELIKWLDIYNSLLKIQIEIIKESNKSVVGLSDDEKIAHMGKINDKLVLMYEKHILNNSEINDLYNDYYGVYFGFSPSDKKSYNNNKYQYAQEQIEKLITEKVEGLKNDIAKSDIKIKLIGYHFTKKNEKRRVHIENFDTFKEGEFTEMDRWVTSFSEKDVQAFQQTNNFANSLNQLVDQSFKDVGSVLKTNIESYECIESLYQQVSELYEKKDEILTGNQTLGTAFILEFKKQINGLLQSIESLKTWDLSNSNALEVFNNKQDVILDQVNLSIAQIQNLMDDAKNQNLQTINSIKELVDAYKDCKIKVEKDLENIKIIVKFSKDLLGPANKVSNVLAADDGEALSFGINDLPRFGYLDLKTIEGKRADNERITLRVIVISKSGENNKEDEEEVIELYNIKMKQIKMHSISNVSLILASPYNYDATKVTLDKTFQFAPAGNLLFKWGSRKSSFGNFISPGFGFTISSPDFDLDGTPEVGVGVVGTLLQDILAFGVAYNTGTDNPYWFFGLSLPFSTLGMPINTIKNTD